MSRELLPVLRRSSIEFRANNLTTLAAALTYYGVMAAVPGLIVLFIGLGYAGRNVSHTISVQVIKVAPGSSGHFVQTLIAQAQQHKTGSGLTAIVGVLIALWSASSYVNSFRQASNVIYGIREGRPLWKTIPLRLALTMLSVLVLVLGAVIVVVSGSIADAVGNAIGAGHTAVLAWGIVKWPLLVVLVSVLLALLFWASPNAKQGHIMWISPGGVIATLLWIMASGLFAVYVTNFSSYDKTYGALAGIVIFLVWMWLTNLSLLFGAQVNAEIEHTQVIAKGLPPDMRPFAEPRDTSKLPERDRQAVERAQALMTGGESAGMSGPE
jgi:membrane protein